MKKIGFTILFLMFLFSCKKEKERICDVYDEPNGYSIGTINSYVKGVGRVTYKYDFFVNQSRYSGKEKAYGINQSNERLLGQSYLVVFKLSDPGESDLNMNYKINSLEEFDELLNEFETIPPERDWPKKCKDD